MHQGLLEYQLSIAHHGLCLHPNAHLVLENRVSLAQLASRQVLHLTPSLYEKEIVHSWESTSFLEKDVGLNSRRDKEEM